MITIGKKSSWLFSLGSMFVALSGFADGDAEKAKAEQYQVKNIPVNGPATVVIPGQDMGMEKGDILQEIDGQKVDNAIDSAQRLLKEKNTIKEITVLRHGKQKVLKNKARGTAAASEKAE